ncbi:MAG: acetyltransferase [Acidimicrobiales bacterium]
MDVLVWGGTGQTKVVARMLADAGDSVVAVCDRDLKVSPPLEGVQLIHTEGDLLAWLSTRRAGSTHFVAAIGGHGGDSRLDVDAYLSARGLAPASVVHPAAWVDSSTHLGEGSQILAMAAVGVAASLGRQCIVNTNATIDHECRLGDGVHVMPGAVAAGEVTIGDLAVIGSNATVLPRLRVGEGAFVGAGAVVTHDVAPYSTVVGVPARSTGSQPRRRRERVNPWEVG